MPVTKDDVSTVKIHARNKRGWNIIKASAFNKGRHHLWTAEDQAERKKADAVYAAQAKKERDAAEAKTNDGSPKHEAGSQQPEA